MALLTYLLAGTAILVFVSRTLLRVDVRSGFALLLLPLLFTGEAIVRGAAYAPADIPLFSEPLSSHAKSRGFAEARSPALSDVATLMIPWREAVRASYARGEWPLWNPSILCGDILAAASEPGPYHPVRLLSMILSPAAGITLEASMTLLLSGLAMFLMLRSRELSTMPAVVGAAVWMFSDFLTFYLEYPMGSAVSMLPFLCFAIDCLLEREVVRGFYALSAGFVLLILAGHPESTLHVVTITAIYFLIRLVTLRREGWLRRTGFAILAGIGAVGVSAIFLIPFAEALPQTFEFSFRIGHEASTRRSFDVADAARRMSASFFPASFGDNRREVAHELEVPGILWTGFSGVLPLALALVAGVVGLRRAAPWLLLLLFGLLSGSRFPGVMEALDFLPLFEIALNDRLIFLVPFALAVLCAFGISFLESCHPRARRALVTGVVTYTAILILLGLSNPAGGLSEAFVLEEIIQVGIFAVVAMVGIYSLRRSSSRVVFLLALLLFERASRRADFHPTVDAADFYPATALIRTVQSDRELSRIVAAEFSFVPNISTMYGIDDARGFEGMTFNRLYETFPLWSVHQPVWFNRVDDLSSPFLSMVNVRYAIVSDHFLKRSDWQSIARDGRSELLRNRRTFSRAFIPRNVAFTNREKSVAAMREVADFQEISIIESDVEGRTANGPASVTVGRRGSGYRLSVSSVKPVWIFVTESAWKGWRASIKGSEVPLHFGNHAFLALQAPAGDSEIDLRYAPHSFSIGLFLSAITFALYLGAGLLLIRSSRGRA